MISHVKAREALRNSIPVYLSRGGDLYLEDRNRKFFSIPDERYLDFFIELHETFRRKPTRSKDKLYSIDKTYLVLKIRYEEDFYFNVHELCEIRDLMNKYTHSVGADAQGIIFQFVGDVLGIEDAWTGISKRLEEIERKWRLRSMY